MDIKDSYSAASAFPKKLLHQKISRDGKVLPIHVQLIPTNRCNLNCHFCSCGDRDKEKFIPFRTMIKILDSCAKCGTKAITITGGGEPLLYYRINETIRLAEEKGINIGLVTNGLALWNLWEHSNLVWCRISSSDDRIPSYSSIEYALQKNPQTDWAFSHVVTSKPNYEIINGIIKFANKRDFTHVRLVSDLCNLHSIPSMAIVKKHVLVDDKKVIYQERKDSTPGTKECYISLLKPAISPEGIFPCCGTQYAMSNSKRDMINKMKMGKLNELGKIIDEQKHFNGSRCDVCYYSQYNELLKEILNKPEHLEFV